MWPCAGQGGHTGVIWGSGVSAGVIVVVLVVAVICVCSVVVIIVHMWR